MGLIKILIACEVKKSGNVHKNSQSEIKNREEGKKVEDFSRFFEECGEE